MMEAMQVQPFGDLHKHGSILKINDSFGWNLGDIQRNPVNVRVGLPKMEKTRHDKEIHEGSQAKLLNTIADQFPPLVTDHDNFELILLLEGLNICHHRQVRLGLGKHVGSEF